MAAPHPDLADFPIIERIPVAWGDMDAFQHVNNVVYLKWFETARIAFFQAVGWIELIAKIPGGHSYVASPSWLAVAGWYATQQRNRVLPIGGAYGVDITWRGESD